MHHIGLALQFAVLIALPVLMLWQIQFGLPLLVMPIGLLAGMVVFGIGTRLRESK